MNQSNYHGEGLIITLTQRKRVGVQRGGAGRQGVYVRGEVCGHWGVCASLYRVKRGKNIKINMSGR